jgi:hypothetical protein
MNYRYPNKFLIPILLIMAASIGSAQYYGINEKIETEDLESTLISGDGMLRVGHGEGWVNHSSEFIYSMCGNRHWLCSNDVVPECRGNCADEYIEAAIDIPSTGYYVIYAYVAAWPDSANIVGNRTCAKEDRFEGSHWFLAWDNATLLDKVMDNGGEMNVERDYLWSMYPYDTYCGQFAMDTVILGMVRCDCNDLCDPSDCDFPREEFFLTAGEHTLYLKVAEEYSLIDWLMVSGVDGHSGRIFTVTELSQSVQSGNGHRVLPPAAGGS